MMNQEHYPKAHIVKIFQTHQTPAGSILQYHSGDSKIIVLYVILPDVSFDIVAG